MVSTVRAGLGQLKFGDDLGTQQAGDEGARRPLGAGDQLLGDAGAAHEVARLEHQHRLACAGQVVGGDEAVVAGADDDGVVVSGHRNS